MKSTFESAKYGFGIVKKIEVGVLLILIIVSLIVAAGFLSAFIWASRNGQFDDDLSPSVRILMEDEIIQKNNLNEKNNSTEKSNGKK